MSWLYSPLLPGGAQLLSSSSTPKTGSDSGSGSDASALTATVATTDSGTGADSSALTWANAAVTDSGTGSDASSVSTPVPTTDSGTGADASALTAAVPVTEAGTGADVSDLVSAGNAVTDSGTGADASALAAAYPTTDSGTGVEAAGSISYVVFPNVYKVFAHEPSSRHVRSALTITGLWRTDFPVVYANRSDSGTGDDASALVVALPLTDDGAGAEASDVPYAPAVTDSGSGADSSSTAVPVAVTDTGAGDDSADSLLIVALALTEDGTGADASSVLGNQAPSIPKALKAIIAHTPEKRRQRTLIIAALTPGANRTVSVTDEGVGSDSSFVSMGARPPLALVVRAHTPAERKQHTQLISGFSISTPGDDDQSINVSDSGTALETGSVITPSTVGARRSVALQGVVYQPLLNRAVQAFHRQEPKDPVPYVLVYLYSAPPTFTYAADGVSNQNWVRKAYKAHQTEQKMLGSRIAVRVFSTTQPMRTDTGTLADSASLVVAVSASDFGMGSDTASFSSSSKTVSDSGVGSDTATIALQFTATDSGSGDDGSSLRAIVAVSEESLDNDDVAYFADVHEVMVLDAGAGSADNVATLQVSISVADDAVGDDVTSSTRLFAATDSGAGADATSLLASLPRTDSGSGTEAARQSRLVTDSGTGADSALLIVALPRTDSGTATDASSVRALVSATDAATTTDQAAPGFGFSVTDSATGSDAAVMSRHVTTSDSGTGSDSLSLAAALPRTDSGTGAETKFITAVINAIESITGVDAVAQGVALSRSDSGSGAETLAKGQYVNDAGTGVDVVASLVASIRKTDSGAGTDASDLGYDGTFYDRDGTILPVQPTQITVGQSGPSIAGARSGIIRRGRGGAIKKRGDA